MDKDLDGTKRLQERALVGFAALIVLALGIVTFWPLAGAQTFAYESGVDTTSLNEDEEFEGDSVRAVAQGESVPDAEPSNESIPAAETGTAPPEQGNFSSSSERTTTTTTTTATINEAGKPDTTTIPAENPTTTAAARVEPRNETSSSVPPETTTTIAPTSTTPTTTTTTTTTGPRGRLSGTLYVNPNTQAANWVSSHPTDGRADTIHSEIASVATSAWFGDWTNNPEVEVGNYVNQAQSQGQIPTLVLYNIPDRDCGQHSAGGAPSMAAYEAWIDQVADGLGDGKAIIVLEPDSLALNGCAGSERNDVLSNAVTTIKDDCAACRVYLDAGHSNWVEPNEMASRLMSAGIDQADGFFTNVSNYNTTSNEESFGADVLSALGNPSGMGQIVDTSRNGNGPANGQWCDPPGRAVGSQPTLSTGNSNVHGYLWVKAPGESDGCSGAAGQFVAESAYELATA